MCGICGIHRLSTTPVVDAPAVIAAMTRALAHRGPDDDQAWSDAERGVHFGFRRLSIIDLSTGGRQPRTGRHGTTLMMNGEIYNYRELKRGLADYPFESASDSEVLVAGLETRGESFLAEVNGMFAFAWWDARRRRLVLARDRLGIKPLYYTELGGRFAFASEIRALLELPWVSARLDRDALATFLTFNKVRPPATLFEGIRKLHPGHLMVIGDGGIERYEPFWEARIEGEGRRPRADYRREVRAALEASVDLRMVSDVPVGAFLSGGVDSTAVAALMAERSSSPVRTYTIGFDEPAYDERGFAAGVAEAIGAEHHERVVTRAEVADFLPTVAEVFDDPLADATSIPIYFLSQLAAADGTKVILTGDGADELFCGYRGWAAYERAYPLYRLLSSRWNPVRPLLGAVGSMLAPASRTREILRRIGKGEEFFWGGAGGLKRGALEAILTDSETLPDSYAEVRQARAAFDERMPAGRRSSDLDWLSYVGITDIVPNYYLHRADRLGMAASIELRVPFLDHRLVELGLEVPGRFKIERGNPKAILKDAVADLVPEELVNRPKMGFCVPLHEWFGASIQDHVETHLDGFCSDTGLFRADAVRQLCREAAAAEGRGVHGLWNFYFLMTWFDRWLS